MKIDHDGHMHTYLSFCCHDEKCIPTNILKKASQTGIKIVNFTDHLWERGMPGTTEPYKTDQDIDHIMQIKKMMPKDTFGVKALISCETDYLGDGHIGLSKESASMFDFVLAPTNHSLTDYYKDKGITQTKDISKNLLQRFREVLTFDVANGIAHPFLPLGYFDRGDEILNSMEASELRECFHMAREKGVSIELNTDTFATNWNRNTDAFTNSSYMRIYHIAKEANSLFHFASDAHSIEDMDLLGKMQPFVDELGIEKSDIHPTFRT
ncbi:MAG: hypothetical protein KAG94_03435 [Clostridiales bacterium]|nr:hypothetical protein [Clostridiales bacterium]